MSRAEHPATGSVLATGESERFLAKCDAQCMLCSPVADNSPVPVIY